MENKTPTTMGGRGLETLGSNLKPQDTLTHQHEQVCCVNCAHYDPKQRNIGLCRRYAPTGDGGFAYTAPDGWCGDYSQRRLGGRQ